MATLPPDWNEFIGLLNAKRVRYLIVGAHALAANGRPRTTQDLDVFVERTKANIARLASALRAFGFADLADECSRFEQPERMATIGNPPLRIDIMNYIDGVTFRDAWRGRLVAQFGDHQVGFLGLDQLRTNKLASARAKDLADVAIMDEMADATRRPRMPSKSRPTAPAAKPRKR
ncbi:MAG TPA: hypothetical protein VFX59_00815 [Polyangiales bacterium]|nr:hypothetical protein [Polyangiales bacterium]